MLFENLSVKVCVTISYHMNDHNEQSVSDNTSLISILREEIECNERTIEELMDQLSKYEATTVNSEHLQKPEKDAINNQFMIEYEEMMHKYHLLIKENKQLQKKNETLRYELDLSRTQNNEKENNESEANQYSHKSDLFAYSDREKVIKAILNPWK